MSKKIDEFYYHEAMDRTFFITQIIGEFLDEHPVIKKHKEVKKLIDTAGDSLAEAYQLLGQIIVDKK